MFDGREAPYQTISCRTSIFVIGGVVSKICLAESPIGGGARGRALGNDRDNSGFMTGKDFFAFEIPPVCNRGQLLGPIASRARVAMEVNCSRSDPTLVT